MLTDIVHASSKLHPISNVPTQTRNYRLQSRLNYYLIIYKNGTVGGILPEFRKDGKTLLLTFISNWLDRLAIPFLEDGQAREEN